MASISPILSLLSLYIINNLGLCMNSLNWGKTSIKLSNFTSSEYKFNKNCSETEQKLHQNYLLSKQGILGDDHESHVRQRTQAMLNRSTWACKAHWHVRHVSIQGKLAHKHENMQGILAYEHPSTQVTLVHENITGLRQTWKTWKTQGILFEANYFDLVQILIGVSHALSSLFDHFATFVLIVGILIFIMQLPLYLKGTLIKKLCFKSHL